MPRADKGQSTGAVDVDAVVVGAGFAGLYAIHRLTALGLRVQGVEKGAGVGGVWYWNRYPGARCDCESYYYSYSFSPELQEAWNWSLRYSEQPEILRYLEHVAERFELRRLIRFGAAVTRASFDDTRSAWRVETSDGETITTRFLITAAGCLSDVHWPDIPGLESFEGRILHTAQWPHEEVSFAARRVGIIGTGASAVQAIPRIARQAGRLTVFQRTPNWVLPARNVAASGDFTSWYKANYSDIRRRCLASGGAVPFDPPLGSAFGVSGEERQAIYESLWAKGGMRFFTAFDDLFVDEAANETAQAFVRSKILASVEDPQTARKLTPHDHPIGVKRPPLEDGYYETYNRPNVTLHDLREHPIVEVDAKGVRTSDRHHPLDDLVLATGFDALTGAITSMDLIGRDGRNLKEKWRAGPSTFMGLGVSGYPNLFTITGPLSPSVLANMPTAVEQHVDWIADCLSYMRRNDLTLVEPTASAEREWTDHSDAVVSRTLYPRAASSWYQGANIPGKARRFGVYVGGFSAYRERCVAIAANEYEGFQFA
ncbi:MAG: flavin-containing monooxygenase [Caulobacteraceae bacterium]